ncbi:MAG TPA: acetate/propionate family kinase [Candidatus Limnocylindrales bacterium]|nr:acetate/propionate family kinase [Candidatus Limnocylindrales bacterium]
MRILVLNPGSSSLKASVIEPPGRDALAATAIAWGADATRSPDRASAIHAVLRDVAAAGVVRESIAAVGHRVVHGGALHTGPVRVDDAVLGAIDDLEPYAPLHNRIAAETIRAARAALPDAVHVAAFDTAFHAGLPEVAYRYPVPAHWSEAWGVRRYGFHGLSVAWSVTRAAELLGRPSGALRLVVAHLGSGCSVTAVEGGRSVDTSMGMTPIEGLMMGSRSGSIDPGIVLALIREGHATAAQLAEALEHGSGLLGVSGLSSDVRDLLAAEAAGDARARLALAMFTRRAAAGIAAAATCLTGVDAVVFTGGIGEHSGTIRARIVDRLGGIGVAPIVPADVEQDGPISTAAGAPAILRIESREDVVIAEAVAKIAR